MSPARAHARAGVGIDMATIVFGYVRISCAKQESGLGREVQADAIRSYCRDAALPEPTIISETESGAKEDRAQLLDLFDRARAAAAAGDTAHCVVYRIDRLGRSLLHVERYIAEAHHIGLVLHSTQPGERQYLDASLADDPDIRLIRQILCALAEHERGVINRRLAAGVKKLNDAGGYTGGAPPFGYRIVDGDLVIDDAKARVALEVLRLRDGGNTLDQIATVMRERRRDVLAWSKHAVRRILSRRNLYENGIYALRLGGEARRPDLIITKEKTA